MKNITLMAAALAATTVLAPDYAYSREAVIGFSPHQKPAVLKAQVERTIRHLIATVEPGESAYLFDAANGNLIAVFAVPDNSAYANPRAKLQANRKALAALKRFKDRAQAIPGREATINLPTLLKSVRKNYSTQDGADLIVLGSPVFDDAKAPTVSMRGGRVGNDGHIAANAGQSVYGTSGITGSLEGYAVYFGLIGSDWSVSNQHEHHVERFWSLSVEGHGGHLAYFGGDLETLFGLASKKRKPDKHSEPLVPTDKLEMLTFAPGNGSVADIYSRPIAEEPAPEPIWKNASNVTIGIAWDAKDVDLDLFVRPNPSASVIFYQNASTSEGRLFKDFRASPKTGFETVALNGRIDLSKLRMAVNYYGGRAPNGRVTGEIRLAIGGDVWAQSFVFNRPKGNKGAGTETVILDNTAPNTAWVILDPLKVLGAK